MKVVVAPDKFKGSLTAVQISKAVAAGIRDAGGSVEIVACPVADGGDGTVAALAAAGFTRRDGGWAEKDGRAVVELAAICGLARSPRRGRNAAFAASTRALGKVLRRVLATNPDELVVAVGGSASTDGGAGMLQGLGASLRTWQNHEIGGGITGLERLTSLSLAGLDPALRRPRLVLAADVDNPLLGEHGAAAIFGPQKGLRAKDWLVVDPTLAHYADLLDAATGTDCRNNPGAGAAGGVGYALQALGATRSPGVDLVLDLIGFDDALDGADLVITGEGMIDASTLRGKAISGVARRARARGIPVVALCGRERITREQLDELGVEQVHTLVQKQPDVALSYEQAPQLLRRMARDVVDQYRG